MVLDLRVGVDARKPQDSDGRGGQQKMSQPLEPVLPFAQDTDSHRDGGLTSESEGTPPKSEVWVPGWSIHLTFKEEAEESAFLYSLRPEVFFRYTAATVTYGILCLISFVFRLDVELRRDDKEFIWAIDDPRTAFFLAHVLFLLLCVGVFCIGAAQQQMLSGNLDYYINWERVMTVCSMAGACVVPFINRELYLGTPPAEVWGQYPSDSKTTLLLLLILNSLATCIFIPTTTHQSLMILFATWNGYVTPIMLSHVADKDNSAFRSDLVGSCLLLALLVFCFVGQRGTEQVMRERFMATQQLIATQEEVRMQKVVIDQGSAMTAGLKAVAEALCDVVVKVDNDLRICDSSRRVATFFERSVEGLEFVELLSDMDKNRFLQLVATASSMSCPACLPFTFRKNSSNCDVHLLLVDLDMSHPRYLIGIRIQGDVPIDTSASQPDFMALPGQTLVSGESSGRNKFKPNKAAESEISFSLSESTFATGFHGEIGGNSLSAPSPKVLKANNHVSLIPKVEVGVQTEATSARPPQVPKMVRDFQQPPPRSSSRGSSRGRMRSNSRSGSREGSRPSSRDSNGSTAKKPILSKFSPTLPLAVEYQLSGTCKLVNWLLPANANPCCQWHGALEALHATVGKLMERTGCDYRDPNTSGGIWAINSDWQCHQCAGMNTDDYKFCEVCGMGNGL
eukprot:TRINITY_DN27009_c0_g1_i1.p1 TRINITY_DN27009_c0_g1~~TRINITY_DN27009_c0_g1_i1.p1  ORF type:complete len:680 (-),score=116.71 TRINITY_DN27009_c0_g1_i1:159-2198(-)